MAPSFSTFRTLVLGVLAGAVAASSPAQSSLRGKSLVQVASTKAHVAHKSKLPGMDDDDDGDGFEYGDREFHARDADSSDYSVHQFLTTDDGRDGTKDADDDQAFVMRRSQALAKEDHFNSEETPSTDSFVQLSTQAKRTARGKALKKKLPGMDDDD